ncbi:hypothetical protein [Amycolatopsis thermophila]|uniref:Lipoprotein n=1 Tax=Amycolatopsis thermophila TaxID=206084 RepID=A0ABU0F2S4_9PSEU|nr:hypothetical protein [Amycolatopsis thermophila]MDQ0381888.1 hypothetical protein [Amycolatopsis thermophila]
MAVLLLAGCRGDEPDDKQYTAPETSAASAATVALAERFAPMVWLADGEDSPPMDATRYVRQAALRYLHPSGCVDRDPVAATIDLGKLGHGDYHHADAQPDPMAPRPPLGAAGPPCGEHQGPDHATNDDKAPFYLEPAGDLQPDAAGTAPAYWEFHREGDGRTALVYWFFYGRNTLNPGNRHDGDWERVAVQLRDDEPLAVTFFGHGGSPCMMPWRELDRRDDHPVVYSAVGSHASYPDAGRHDIYDRTSAGTGWPTWDHAKPVAQEPWYEYAGWWGPQSDVPGFSGPKGPHSGRLLADVFTQDRCGLPKQLPASFTGTWETREPVQQNPARPPYQMRVVFDVPQSTVQYRSDWTTQDPALSCTGVLKPTLVEDKVAEFAETISSDPKLACARDATVRFVRDGEVLRMTSTTGSIRATATLYPKGAAQDPKAPPPSTPAAPGPTIAGALQRYEEFLHALGREDLAKVCEIAGPAAKKAADEGIGTCEETFPITFQMISPAQKRALQSATVDPARVTEKGPTTVEIPASAVKASVSFTEGDLGDSTLEFLHGQWFITG